MLAVKNFFLPERKAPDTPRFSRMPETFLRSIRRRSLRIKRTKSLIVPEHDREKRKSDSFVNSQEWTISRAVPDIRLGIVGSLSSGKSALVHRYLTGTYMQEESPEGGRFKKEVQIDNQSYLLLIRDEGGLPELQFAAWVDAVIFVFSLENEQSFNAIYTYYTKMSHYRNCNDIPIILVGTQDAISERSPRIIDDSRARKLAADLSRRCIYYETCATYGLNVERVFHDACHKIVQQRTSVNNVVNSTPSNSRPTTPQGTRLGLVSGYHHGNVPSPTNNGFLSSAGSQSSVANTQTGSPSHHAMHAANLTLPHRHHSLSSSTHHLPSKMATDSLIQAESRNSLTNQKWGTISHATSQQALLSMSENNNIPKYQPEQSTLHQTFVMSDEKMGPPASTGKASDKSDLPTPTSTPTTTRKNRRRSNLFIPSSKKQEEKLKNSEVGSGRAIPLKQGYLYKKSNKTLNKEWKKKYVTLCDDGRLTYHPSLHDYMDDVHCKVISLQYVTVKVPGQKPRGSKSIITNSSILTKSNQVLADGLGHLSIAKDKNKQNADKVLLTGFEQLRDGTKPTNSQTSGDEGIALSNSNSQSFIGSDNSNSKLDQTPSVKKRHRRMKSSGLKNGDAEDPDGYEFFIVSLDNKQWHFEAANSEERDEWVAAIENEIFKSLQGGESTKTKPQNPADLESMQTIRQRVPGNGFCVDCDAPNPEWASLNLGILMCIECSGIHRNLGSHISKVRSLGLDEWPPGHLSVMLAIGNSLANSVWESNTGGKSKPIPTSTREEKEAWIRAKYESKEFLPPCPSLPPVSQQLIEAVVRSDMKLIVLILAHTGSTFVNVTVNARDLRTPLHLACAIGNLAISQLLVWYNADTKQTDHEGRTCLTYAKAANSLAIVKQSQNTPHHVNAETTKSLVELLVSLGITDPVPLMGGQTGGTLPRRQSLTNNGTNNYEKVPSSVV
ncbi:centaurin-gamma-1A isoform X2 [Culicoides brevitarsis]|uniref:centaurin-gamma-1A isoform X2 n=1 Tax=Culicoides brevitarsis TaxID=469753 RepID=UPI00307C0209